MTLAATGHPPTQAAQAGTAPAGPGEPARSAKPRTDRRLGRIRVVLVVGALLFGAVGIYGVQVRTDGADDAKTHSGILIQEAEQIYHDLSDADATATTMYLHVGEAPADLLKKYNDDLSSAQAAILAATKEAGGDAAAVKALDQIATQLPQYVKLNSTAAANNLLGYPLGFRYLLQASNLMQGTAATPTSGPTGILPWAQNLSQTEADNLSSAEGTAKQFPVPMLVVGVLVLAALAVVQVQESRRTNRVFSPGLLGATAALVIAFAWTGVDVGVQNGHEDKARSRGSDQVSTLATARILSLQGRTEEMLTLVGRGTADDQETTYAGVTEPELAGALRQAESIATDVTGTQLAAAALGDESAWHNQHQALRTLDAQNQYEKAVNSALGQGDFAKGQSAAKSFDALQKDLDGAIKHAEASFTSEADSGTGALAGLEIGLGVLALLMAAAVARGLGRRIAEYQ